MARLIQELKIHTPRKKEMARQHVRSAIDFIKQGQEHIMVAMMFCSDDWKKNRNKYGRLLQLFELASSILITDDRDQRESLQDLYNEINQELENGDYDI